MDLIHLMHGSQELVAALSAAATIAFTALWTPFAERRRVRSEEAAIKVVLGAELRLYAGYHPRSLPTGSGIDDIPRAQGHRERRDDP
jgi:hypothetical protein